MAWNIENIRGYKTYSIFCEEKVSVTSMQQMNSDMLYLYCKTPASNFSDNIREHTVEASISINDQRLRKQTMTFFHYQLRPLISNVIPKYISLYTPHKLYVSGLYFLSDTIVCRYAFSQDPEVLDTKGEVLSKEELICPIVSKRQGQCTLFISTNDGQDFSILGYVIEFSPAPILMGRTPNKISTLGKKLIIVYGKNFPNSAAMYCKIGDYRVSAMVLDDKTLSLLTS